MDLVNDLEDTISILEVRIVESILDVVISQEMCPEIMSSFGSELAAWTLESLKSWIVNLIVMNQEIFRRGEFLIAAADFATSRRFFLPGYRHPPLQWRPLIVIFEKDPKVGFEFRII